MIYGNVLPPSRIGNRDGAAASALPPVRPSTTPRPPDGISASSFFANADNTASEIGPVR